MKITLRGMDERVRDARRVLSPAPRKPARADWAGRVETLRGRRVAVANADTVREDFVAWSDLFERDGHVWVTVVDERDWWRYVILNFEPVRRTDWPAGAVWVLEAERDQDHRLVHGTGP